MKLLRALLLLLVISSVAFAQQGSKITELDEDTAPTGDDLTLTVDDPAGTPVNKKATRKNLLGVQSKTFALNQPTVNEDFCIFKAPAALTISDIYGVALSGTVTGGLYECDSDCANCVAIDTDIAFDGGLDQDDGNLTNPTVDAGDWIKWQTTSVSSPGWFSLQYDFKWD